MSLQVATNPNVKELFDKISEKGEVARVGGVEQFYTVPVSDPKKAFVEPVTEFYGTYILSCKAPFPPLLHYGLKWHPSRILRRGKISNRTPTRSTRSLVGNGPMVGVVKTITKPLLSAPGKALKYVSTTNINTYAQPPLIWRPIESKKGYLVSINSCTSWLSFWQLTRGLPIST